MRYKSKIFKWAFLSFLMIAIFFLCWKNYSTIFRLLIGPKIRAVEPIIVQPIAISARLSEIMPENAIKLREISILEEPFKNKNVITFLQSSSDGNLLVLDSDGTLRRWDLNSQQVLAAYNTLSSSKLGGNFSSDGSLLLTPDISSSEGVSYYHIWDTLTGQNKICFGVNCPGSQAGTSYSTGIIMDPDGNIIVDYHDSAIGSTDLKRRIYKIQDIHNVDSSYIPEITRLVFDPTGSYIAFTLKDGEVEICSVSNFISEENESKSATGKGELYFSPYQSNLEIKTIDLVFDYTRTWLGWLNEKELFLWKITDLISPQKIRMPINNGNAIAYDRSGRLLAIGTSSQILLFDVYKGREISETKVGEVTALYFSLDNRLLLWSDPTGDIHVWGIN